MYYLEFIERDRFMPSALFRHLGDQQSSWVEGARDRMVLQLGRTLGLGPQPSYLAFWKIEGLGRLDDWEAYFGADAWLANRRSRAMHRAIHIQRAGLYDELTESLPVGDGIHYVEYFDAPAAADDATVAAQFGNRARRHGAGNLSLLLRRIGLLGPAPPHLAVWTFPNHVTLNDLARDRPERGPACPVTAGIYRRLGREMP